MDDPTYEHAPWTVEGEIERFGAFGEGGAAATGWKRWVAVLVVASLLLGVAINLFAVVLG